MATQCTGKDGHEEGGRRVQGRRPWWGSGDEAPPPIKKI